MMKHLPRPRRVARLPVARAPAASAPARRLSKLGAIRHNPGNLQGRCFVPEGVEGPMPLVVVLHGCTQDAATYDHGSGWSTLAERERFALLFPEQQRGNNPMLCFNWFSGNHSQRGMGEAASIKAMIDAMRREHDIDGDRIFVTGLSAGGAMASVMLATYPETFAAGAIIAGIAFGCASGVAEGFDCMDGRARSDAAELAASVRRASPHRGPWPRVQIWQGNADTVVAPGNADAIALQWAALHGLGPKPDRIDRIDGHRRKLWLDAKGRRAVEQYVIAGMAHGVPLDSRADDSLGAAGAHMLDVGMSSTQLIADFFGIAPAPAAAAPSEVPRPRAAAGASRPSSAASGVQALIENGLRAAGLMP